MRRDICERVYELVKRVPEGKVTTYGLIGKVLNISPRVVGFALHLNNNPEVPCHRVVNREGRIASAFAFGGARVQRERLEKEGVEFGDETHVELEKYFYGEF
ncbi:cysteine methyltransferase [Candidatus Parcubacteria bacterium]|nr:MAG: cysteine methyltransferase [Candidatus Parcubacteria bacterium]